MDIASDQPVTGLAAAKKAAGTKKKLAELLGVSGALVTKWRSEIPLNWLLQVEAVTGVPRNVLRPDLFVLHPVSFTPRKRKDS